MNAFAKNKLRKLFVSALIIALLFIGWSVQANYNPNAISNTTLTADLTGQEDEGISPLVASCDSPFSNAASVAVKTSPFSVAFGDFNKDGNLDFAAPNSATGVNSVSIRLGNGNGGFTSPATPEVIVGTEPAAVAIADFNKDGNLDFAAANSGSSNVSIRLGNGSGGFTSVADVTVGTTPVSVAIGDFNKDGNLDFAAANLDSGNVSIRLGNGSGGFTGTTTVTVGTSPFSVETGDFNKDGNLDLVTANSGSNTVSLRLGNGSGGFTGTTNIAVGAGPVEVAIGDFNKDGNLDFAAANNGSNNISIRLGNGTGGFTAVTAVTVGTTPVSVALGDFNKDGNLDFVAANFGSNNASIRLGNGAGGFTSPATPQVTLGTGPNSVTLADINNDGNLDFATANFDIDSISIRLGNGSSSFSSPDTTNVTVGTDPFMIATGDINKDGNLDFAIANLTTNNISIRLGNGTGSFTNAADVAVGTGPAGIALGDFNKDGNLDLVAANSGSNTASIRLGNGAGGFTGTTTVTAGTTPVSVVIGDFNKDNNLDFAVANADSNNVSVRLGNGTGGFTNAADVAVGTSPQLIALGDFNKDGNLDFATPNNGSNNVSIKLGNGTGGFTGTTTVTVGTQPTWVAIGDFNNDTNLDFAAANQGSNVISIRLGNGTGGFTSPATPEVTVGPQPYSVGLADFNKDGNLDFIAPNSGTGSGSNSVSIRLGNGSGGFTSPAISEVGTGFMPFSLAIGDFNKDGDQDFATADIATGANTVSVVFGNCQNAQKIFQNIAGTPQSAAINTSFGTNLRARATNAGAPFSGTNVTFTAPATGASGTFAGGTNVVTATTDAAGFVTAPAFTANGVVGSYIVIAKITIAGTDRFRSFSLTNTAACPTITLTPSSLPNGTPGTTYSQTISATGGATPYSFSVATGSLPPGLSLSSAGLLSGSPTSAGTFNFTISARDRNGCTGSRTYTINIGAPITNQATITVTSTNFNTTVSASYVGTYAINTMLRNNGSNLTGPVYFQITTLSKVNTDLDPTRPNRLLSADNSAGVVGDIQTVSTTGIVSGGSIPVSFNVGIGSRQRFSFFVNLFNNTGSKGVAGQIGHYEFTVSEGVARPTANNNQFELSTNPLASNNVDLITGTGSQSRPVTVIDANNTNKIAVVANDLSNQQVILKTTQDGGVSWSSSTLPRTVNGTNFFSAQSGALAYDASGKLLIGYIVGNLNDSANAVVLTSTLDGINFEPLKVIKEYSASEQVIVSRPVIAISATNTTFVAWDSYSTATHNFTIQIASAVAGGNFRTPVNVASGQVSTPALAISKGGIIYVGWNHWGFNSTAPLYNTGGRLMVAYSRTNGNSFTPATQIGLTNIGFARNISAMPDAGVTPSLTLVADNKIENTLYAAYTTLGKGLDVVFASSGNLGQNWKPAQVVNNDAGNADQFNPSMAISKVNGSIKIAFYDTRLNGTTGDAHIFMAISVNGGASFNNSQVTTIASNDSKANLARDYSANLGDRIGLAIQGGVTVLTWTDTRLGDEDIFIQTFTTN